MNPTARLTRITADPRHGTFGVFALLNTPICVTLEPYHRDNEIGISCINAGVYRCKRIISATYGETFSIEDVEGRTLLRFHWGNLDTNTKGCVLMGEEYGKIGSNTAILSSKRAFREFMSLLDGCDEFTLTIVDCY